MYAKETSRMLSRKGMTMVESELKELVQAVFEDMKNGTIPERPDLWISVEERLPEDFGRYLILSDSSIRVDYYSRYGWLSEWPNIHWQPMPEGKKLGEKNDD